MNALTKTTHTISSRTQTRAKKTRYRTGARWWSHAQQPTRPKHDGARCPRTRRAVPRRAAHRPPFRAAHRRAAPCRAPRLAPCLVLSVRRAVCRAVRVVPRRAPCRLAPCRAVPCRARAPSTPQRRARSATRSAAARRVRAAPEPMRAGFRRLRLARRARHVPSICAPRDEPGCGKPTHATCRQRQDAAGRAGMHAMQSTTHCKSRRLAKICGMLVGRWIPASATRIEAMVFSEHFFGRWVHCPRAAWYRARHLCVGTPRRNGVRVRRREGMLTRCSLEILRGRVPRTRALCAARRGAAG